MKGESSGKEVTKTRGGRSSEGMGNFFGDGGSSGRGRGADWKGL